MPVFRLGRLAVSLAMHGQGLGGDLLLASVVRALAVAAQIGGVALAIDANDSKAAGWYERFGAIRLLDDPLKLILPLGTIAAAVSPHVALRFTPRCPSRKPSRTKPKTASCRAR